MTEQEIKDLIQSLLEPLKSEILNTVDQKNAGLASSLTKELKKVVKPSEEDSKGASKEDPKELTLKALEQQITDLNSKLQAKEQSEFQAKRSSAISDSLTKVQVTNPALFQKVFRTNYENKLKQENEEWFVEEGDRVVKLNDLVNSYLQTDEGKYFLPPSDVTGSGSKTSSNSTPAKTSTKEDKKGIGHSIATQLEKL